MMDAEVLDFIRPDSERPLHLWATIYLVMHIFVQPILVKRIKPIVKKTMQLILRMASGLEDRCAYFCVCDMSYMHYWLISLVTFSIN